MSDSESKPKSATHLIYALISFSCPFVAFAIVSIYQQSAHDEFWGKLVPGDDASNAAGAMMAIAEFAEMAFAVFIGCVLGIVFAGLSLWKKPRLLSFGLAALLFNALPIVLLLLLYVRALTRGL
jgi:hypothetical protein